MPSAQARLIFNINALLESAVDLGTGQHKLDYGINYNLTDGTGADQVKTIFADSRNIVASGSENLDLAGVLTDIFGNFITFSKLKIIVIKAAAANVNDVLVGGHATAACFTMFNAATDKLRVKPGGSAILVAPNAVGFAVTATTADMLTIANSSSGSAIDYDVIIGGTV